MESHLTVDYDQLVSSYKESLTSLLRGFRPPAELLETWVPDEDDTKSLFNLIEAAEAAGLAGVSIHAGPGTFRRLDLESLQQMAGRRGKMRTETSPEGILLHISFADPGTDLRSSAPDSNAGAKPKPELVVRKKNGQPPSTEAPSPYASVPFGTRTIHPVYMKRLQKESPSCTHEGALVPEPGLELAQASRQHTTLMALVKPHQHLVQKATFCGARSDEERAVFNLLCKAMEGRPILECADHAMIYVERELRDPSQPPPVPGIVTPENADPIFALPAFLVRELFSRYRRTTGFSSMANFYDPPPTAEWLALPENEKVARVQAAIARHPLGGGIEVVRTEGAKRVSVRCPEGPGPGLKASRLMQLEAHVHAEVEPTLELETEPRADGNKIRRIKEMSRS